MIYYAKSYAYLLAACDPRSGAGTYTVATKRSETEFNNE